ncbi:Piso0_000056 [Millerozyma farinosa CBS 7064]|uniref:Piso0_000056 protein n=1 Tax=Pichia sorbitophila (strain ATCC MYA-4447 / BCRC 22081 / CBS 7064 / NBRC 10061 / NRRL Y-12695) TaxID=559304 RepID=G8YSZ4_PICSO|nr:Piso0_000056 [Millerozyma farinosa CBS 7064]
MSDISNYTNSISVVRSNVTSSYHRDTVGLYFRIVPFTINMIFDGDREQAGSFIQEKYGPLFSYSLSAYGFTCFLMALVMNRTFEFASTNLSHLQRLEVDSSRGLQRAPNSTGFIRNMSLKGFRIIATSILLYNLYCVLVCLNLFYRLSLSGSEEAPFLAQLLMNPLFDYDADAFSNNKYMATPKYQVMIGPTSRVLWSIFLGFCLSSFLDAFVSGIQGHEHYTELGLTLFEISLAFHEASRDIGKHKIFSRLNEQVLVLCAFQILNHLNIHVGWMINNNRYRLIPSTVIGVSFLIYFTTNAMHGNLLKFPLIIIFSFAPYILMVFFILISLAIFALAWISIGFKLQDLNYASFFVGADNFNEDRPRWLNFNLYDDFYSVLLNLGSLAVSSAGRTSYIKELSLVVLDHETWLERESWSNIKAYIDSQVCTKNDEIQKSMGATNGYDEVIRYPSLARVSNASQLANADLSDFSRPYSSVIGKRFYYLCSVAKNCFQLVFSLLKRLFLIKIFSLVGYRRQTDQRNSLENIPKFLHSYIPSWSESISELKNDANKGVISINRSTKIDFGNSDRESDYLMLLQNDSLDEVDESEDYIPDPYDYSDTDPERASVRSRDETDNVVHSRDATYDLPDEYVSYGDIADLFSPENLSILHCHINHRTAENSVLTRSKYANMAHEFEREADFTQSAQEKLLETILERKAQVAELQSHGADEPDTSRLLCVVCQYNPREVITWPCKCFAICDVCRLNLVAKRIDGCVCCRREVKGVTKVYIP